jgi:hypothetical protein
MQLCFHLMGQNCHLLMIAEPDSGIYLLERACRHFEDRADYVDYHVNEADFSQVARHSRHYRTTMLKLASSNPIRPGGTNSGYFDIFVVAKICLGIYSLTDLNRGFSISAK